MHSLSDEAKALLGTLLECIELQVRACRDWVIRIMILILFRKSRVWQG